MILLAVPVTAQGKTAVDHTLTLGSFEDEGWVLYPPESDMKLGINVQTNSSVSVMLLTSSDYNEWTSNILNLFGSKPDGTTWQVSDELIIDVELEGKENWVFLVMNSNMLSTAEVHVTLDISSTKLPPVVVGGLLLVGVGVVVGLVIFARRKIEDKRYSRRQTTAPPPPLTYQSYQGNDSPEGW